MTINLFNYDSTTKQIDKTKTWIDVKRKRLISREIKFKQYYSICKKDGFFLMNYNIKTQQLLNGIKTKNIDIITKIIQNIWIVYSCANGLNI